MQALSSKRSQIKFAINSGHSSYFNFLKLSQSLSLNGPMDSCSTCYIDSKANFVCFFVVAVVFLLRYPPLKDDPLRLDMAPVTVESEG